MTIINQGLIGVLIGMAYLSPTISQDAAAQPSVQGTCGAVISGRNGGTIASPGYPTSNYPSSANCTYEITAPPGYVIVYSSTYFDIEIPGVNEGEDADQARCFDMVDIYRTGNLSDRPETYCGNSIVYPAATVGNKLIVRFTSDHSEEFSGFVLSWYILNPNERNPVFNCDFDGPLGLCPGWTQGKDDSADWIFQRGPTRSAGTGPLNDHTTGNISGKYAYNEASGLKFGNTSLLFSPTVTLSDTAGYCLDFWFHNSGSHEGWLRLLIVFSDKSFIQLDEVKDIDPNWKNLKYSLKPRSEPVQIAFEAVRGRGFRSDVAIDDVKLETGKCEGDFFENEYFDTIECQDNEFNCSDGSCISMDKLCNGIFDCPDAEDEENCTDIFSTTSTKPVSTSQTSPQECQSNLVYTSCASACVHTCADGEVAPPCTLNCVAKCACPIDLPILHEGRCIAYKDCPAVAPPPPTTSTTTEAQAGTVTTSASSTTPPTPSCPENLVYNACASECNHTCSDGDIVPPCNRRCVPRCACPPEIPIIHEGRCIVLQDCPSLEAVSSLSVAGLNQTSANVSFSFVSTPKSYRITISQESNPAAKGETIAPNAFKDSGAITTLTFSDLSPDTTYLVQVFSIRGTEQVPSEVFKFTTLSYPTEAPSTTEASSVAATSSPTTLQVTTTTAEGCGSGNFTCDDGTCVSLAFKCDNIPDCPDGSDELNCTDSACEPGQFACAEKCIDIVAVCNGFSDCLDGSDESGCPPIVLPSSTTTTQETTTTQKTTTETQPTKSTPAPGKKACHLEQEKILLLALNDPSLYATMPQCDRDGRYYSYQCISRSRVCVCVVEETGQEIPGTEFSASSPPPCSSLTACQTQFKNIALFHAENPNMQDGPIYPTCSSDGLFTREQCNQFTGNCWCVEPETGVRVECPSPPPPTSAQSDTSAPVTETSTTTIMATVAPTTTQSPVSTEQPTTATTTTTPVMETSTVSAFIGCNEKLQQAIIMMTSGQGGDVAIPICDSNGMYMPQQCDTGNRCWCVVKETGQTIPGTDSAENSGVPFDCSSLSKCQREFEQTALFIYNNPQSANRPNYPNCTSAGLFEMKQCNEVTGRCWCVIPETGDNIPMTDTFNGASLDCSQLTMCQQRYLETGQYIANNPTVMDGPTFPNCSNNGNFAAKQCNGFTNECRCVLEHDGQIIPGTFKRDGSSLNCSELTHCQTKFVETGSFLAAHPGILGGPSPPECNRDGLYVRKQCESSLGLCRCVVPETGDLIPGTMMEYPGAPDLNCSKLTKCQSQYLNTSRYMYENQGLMDGPERPNCADNGQYAPRQCNSFTGVCWCALPHSGDQIPGTQTQPGFGSSLNCSELTECQQLYVNVGKFVVENPELAAGAEFPACGADGLFVPLQCEASGLCWCVQPETGDVISGSATPRGVRLDCAEFLDQRPPAPCGGNFTDASGTFTSPDYPNPYTISGACDYALLRNDSAQYVELYIDDLQLGNVGQRGNCVEDRLEITSSTSLTPYSICGSNAPPGPMTFGSDVNVRLVPGIQGGQYGGFSARYRFLYCDIPDQRFIQTSRCDSTCSDLIPVCTFDLVQRCACPPETPVLHLGRCITPAECPPPLDEGSGLLGDPTTQPETTTGGGDAAAAPDASTTTPVDIQPTTTDQQSTLTPSPTTNQPSTTTQTSTSNPPSTGAPSSTTNQPSTTEPTSQLPSSTQPPSTTTQATTTSPITTTNQPSTAEPSTTSTHSSTTQSTSQQPPTSTTNQPTITSSSQAATHQPATTTPPLRLGLNGLSVKNVTSSRGCLWINGTADIQLYTVDIYYASRLNSSIGTFNFTSTPGKTLYDVCIGTLPADTSFSVVVWGENKRNNGPSLSTTFATSPAEPPTGAPLVDSSSSASPTTSASQSASTTSAPATSPSSASTTGETGSPSPSTTREASTAQLGTTTSPTAIGGAAEEQSSAFVGQSTTTAVTAAQRMDSTTDIGSGFPVESSETSTTDGVSDPAQRAGDDVATSTTQAQTGSSQTTAGTTQSAPETTTGMPLASTTQSMPETSTGSMSPASTTQSVPETTAGSMPPASTTQSVPETTTGSMPPTSTTQSVPETTAGSMPTASTTQSVPETTTGSMPPTSTTQSVPETTTGSMPPPSTTQSVPETTTGSMPTASTTQSVPETTTGSMPPTSTTQSVPETTAGSMPTASTTQSVPETTTGSMAPASTTQSVPETTTGGMAPASTTQSVPETTTGSMPMASTTQSVPETTTGSMTPASTTQSVPETTTGSMAPASTTQPVPETTTGSMPMASTTQSVPETTTGSMPPASTTQPVAETTTGITSSSTTTQIPVETASTVASPVATSRPASTNGVDASAASAQTTPSSPVPTAGTTDIVTSPGTAAPSSETSGPTFTVTTDRPSQPAATTTVTSAPPPSTSTVTTTQSSAVATSSAATTTQNFATGSATTATVPGTTQPSISVTTTAAPTTAAPAPVQAEPMPITPDTACIKVKYDPAADAYLISLDQVAAASNAGFSNVSEVPAVSPFSYECFYNTVPGQQYVASVFPRKGGKTIGSATNVNFTAPALPPTSAPNPNYQQSNATKQWVDNLNKWRNDTVNKWFQLASSYMTTFGSSLPGISPDPTQCPTPHKPPCSVQPRTFIDFNGCLFLVCDSPPTSGAFTQSDVALWEKEYATYTNYLLPQWQKLFDAYNQQASGPAGK